MANVVTHTGNRITVIFDGSTNFDLCDYLGVNEVSLKKIKQLAVAANDTLTVRDGSTTAVEIYGPFKDVTGSGLIEYFEGESCKPFVKGSEATASSKAQFVADYVKVG